MLWTIAPVALCTSVVGFYIRFLLALWEECTARSRGYRTLRLEFAENAVVVDQTPPSISHAA